MSSVVDKENDPNAQPNAATAPSKTASLKDDGKDCPYERRMEELDEARKAAGDDMVLFLLNDQEELMSNLMRTHFEGSYFEELEHEDQQRALKMLSQEDVDKGIHCMIVSRNTIDLKQKYKEDIVYSDDRFNSRGDGILMFNTYSSWCMYPVIGKQFTAAVKEINKATKQIHGPNEVPGVAKAALEVAVAAIFAAHGMDHWRCDTEAPEEVEKLAKRLVKLVKDLLCFTDAELGFTERFSRQGLIYYLDNLADDWVSNASDMGYELPKMNFKTKKNGNGMGRSLNADDNPAPTKKPKSVQVSSAAVASAPSGASSGASLTSFFSDIHDKISLRVKTTVQLQITDLQEPSKIDHVVLSGATDMKKIHHLMAYMTSCTSNYEYHSQRGSSTKGCRFELRVPGYKTCWLAEKAAAKKAAASGAEAVVDKSVKIVQVFQGLNCSADGGMVYDSELAETIATTPNSLVFVTPENKRFGIKVQAIAPTKTTPGKSPALPRIVTYRVGQRKSGLGLPLQQSKRVMQGDRKDPQLLLLGHYTTSEMNKIHFESWTKPICNMDGTGVCRRGSYSMWNKEALQSAGPPASVAM